MSTDVKADFSITIDFQKGQGSPSRVFRAMSELIDAFQQIDETLIGSINSTIEPVIVLEDVEIGSLKTWLRQTLVSVDDEALKSLEWKEIVGSYLVKGKTILINYMDKTTTVTNESLDVVEAQLMGLASATEVQYLPAYTPISRRALLEDIQRINQALSPLESGDKASFSGGGEVASFNLSFSLTPETIDALIISEAQEHIATMIMKVKKPDFMGDSMWQFHYDKRTIDVKISDDAWLRSFQEGEVPLAPGDAIRARVAIQVDYDYEGNVVDTHYTIVSIESVMPKSQPRQQRMFEDSPRQLPQANP